MIGSAQGTSTRGKRKGGLGKGRGRQRKTKKGGISAYLTSDTMLGREGGEGEQKRLLVEGRMEYLKGEGNKKARETTLGGFGLAYTTSSDIRKTKN